MGGAIPLIAETRTPGGAGGVWGTWRLASEGHVDSVCCVLSRVTLFHNL